MLTFYVHNSTNYMNRTWTCHICGEKRHDSKIRIYTFPMKELPQARINIRYCSDKESCCQKAVEFGLKGEFPSNCSGTANIEKQETIVKKHWLYSNFIANNLKKLFWFILGVILVLFYYLFKF